VSLGWSFLVFVHFLCAFAIPACANNCKMSWLMDFKLFPLGLVLLNQMKNKFPDILLLHIKGWLFYWIFVSGVAQVLFVGENSCNNFQGYMLSY